MYKRFFGLRENPFNINPDPRFLHRTPRIQEALDQLVYGVQNRKGLMLLTGEVGTGKTTLINHLLDWLRERQTPTAFIFNSHLQVNHLFDFILNDFGISTDFHLVSNMLLDLNQWLLKRFRDGSTPVLIVDEAQGLSLELLEEIRLLLNLETASEKLLQIVLVGQPELEEKLKRPELRQLRQRIALHCHTAPLTLDETHGYIVDRLRIAGATREPVFESGAVEALHYYSRGIPRVVNLLCEHALINAYVEGLNPVAPAMVEEAARDFLMDEFRPLSARHSMPTHMDSRLSVMNSGFAGETGRAFREEAGSLMESSRPERPAAAIGLSQEKHESAAVGNMRGIAPAESERLVSEADLDTSLSLSDLSPTLQLKQGPSTNSLQAIARQSDCAAELVATIGRMLESSSASSQLALHQLKNEPSPTANRTEMVASRNRIFSVDTLNRTPSGLNQQWVHGFPSLNALRGSDGSLHWQANSAAAWSRLSQEARANIMKLIHPMKVLVRRWIFDFKRDWDAVIRAIPTPLLKKSMLRWLREPISYKRLVSSKN